MLLLKLGLADYARGFSKDNKNVIFGTQAISCLQSMGDVILYYTKQINCLHLLVLIFARPGQLHSIATVSMERIVKGFSTP